MKRLTVLQLKNGFKLDESPVYESDSYVVLNGGLILHAGNIESIKNLPSYYDCNLVDIRRHDLFLHDNTKITTPVLSGQLLAIADSLKTDLLMAIEDSNDFQNKNWNHGQLTGIKICIRNIAESIDSELKEVFLNHIGLKI